MPSVRATIEMSLALRAAHQVESLLPVSQPLFKRRGEPTRPIQAMHRQSCRKS